jgi:hypothetical protein
MCGIACVLVALFLVVQLLGLLFIETIADRASDPNKRVRIPLAVRGMGVVADMLHDDVLGVKLAPDGSNWPKAFRWFFILEMCGLAGLALAFGQCACAILAERKDWFQQSRTIMFWSFFAMVVGFLLLMMIEKDRRLTGEVTKSTTLVTISHLAA